MSLIIAVGGRPLTHWITCEIERGLDTFAHRFSLRYVARRNTVSQAIEAATARVRREPYTDTREDSADVALGSHVAIYWAGELLLTGNVDSLNQHITGDEQTWSAEGRSLTGDLVDCSATHKTGTWSAKSALQIARDLCEPFGLEVISKEHDAETFSRFAIEEGESVFDALDRLCKVRGLLPITRPTGGVELLRISADQKSVELQTANYRSVDRSLEQNISQRYSHYLLHGTDVDERANVTDSAVKRYRPLVVVGDSRATAAQARTRATWERAVRAGRSERIRYQIPSAVSDTGLTFAPGLLVQILDFEFRTYGSLVIARSVLRVSDREVMSEIELCRPESYSLREFPDKLLSGTTVKGKAKRHKTKPGK